MKVEDMAKVYQGITLSRIKNKDVEIEEYLIYSFLEIGRASCRERV